MKVLIIGGVAGGASAAARLRRLDESAEIVVIERTGYVSYANCGLPYFIGGEITDESKLTLQTPKSFHDRFRIDVRVRQEAVAIDRAKKTVRIKRLEDGVEYVEPYDKLILSPGAKAIRPDVPGVDDPRVMTLRTVEDTFAIHEFIEREKPRRAVVIGAGFIGLEMAENLVSKGLEVTVLQRPAQAMPMLDADMAALLHNQLRKNGIVLHTKTDVTEIAKQGEGLSVRTAEGASIPADLVIMAVGVAPESTLAADAGLELGIKGAIKTNDRMQTSDPDIYAVGDAVEVTHFVTGEPAAIALAGPANKQGRVAADSICGIHHEFTGSQGSSIMKMFDMAVAATGLNSRAAKAAGLDFSSVILTSPSHATYYPGSRSMTLKVLFERTNGSILGAQIVGFDGVDKRIDVLATAIRARMTADDLAELDLAYAPPFSSAKDPVNMVGFVIQNILEGLVKQVSWAEAEARSEGVVLLDTRTQAEFDKGHLEGALHIPLNSLRERIDEIPSDHPLYVYCQSGLRSYIACRILSQHGFDCFNVSGGYGFYASVKSDAEFREEGRGGCGLKA